MTSKARKDILNFDNEHGNRNDLATAKANSRVRYSWANGNGNEMIVLGKRRSLRLKWGGHVLILILLSEKKDSFDNGAALAACVCLHEERDE